MTDRPYLTATEADARVRHGPPAFTPGRPPWREGFDTYGVQVQRHLAARMARAGNDDAALTLLRDLAAEFAAMKPEAPR